MSKLWGSIGAFGSTLIEGIGDIFGIGDDLVAAWIDEIDRGNLNSVINQISNRARMLKDTGKLGALRGLLAKLSYSAPSHNKRAIEQAQAKIADLIKKADDGLSQVESKLVESQAASDDIANISTKSQKGDFEGTAGYDLKVKSEGKAKEAENMLKNVEESLNTNIII